ncbi:MAG: zinc ribbon domain-containing protein [Polyangiaceae bacterium]
MPTYEYVCTSCGNAWEEIQKITEPALDTCPKCKAVTAKRQINGGNFILKGGGWYADLYSSAKPGAKGSSESTGSSSSSSSSSGTSGSGSSGGDSSGTSTSSAPSSAGSSGSSGSTGGSSTPSKT